MSINTNRDCSQSQKYLKNKHTNKGPIQMHTTPQFVIGLKYLAIYMKRLPQIEDEVASSIVGGTSGLAAIPNRIEEFKQCLELSLQYCSSLKCKW